MPEIESKSLWKKGMGPTRGIQSLLQRRAIPPRDISSHINMCSQILFCLDAGGTMVAQWLLLHPTCTRQAQEAPQEYGMLGHQRILEDHVGHMVRIWQWRPPLVPSALLLLPPSSTLSACLENVHHQWQCNLPATGSVWVPLGAEDRH